MFPYNHHLHYPFDNSDLALEVACQGNFADHIVVIHLVDTDVADDFGDIALDTVVVAVVVADMFGSVLAENMVVVVQ